MLESYEFVVSIDRQKDGRYKYAVMQEFYEGDCGDPEWQLLETGETDTLEDAADTAGKSLKTLFNN